MRAPFSRLFLAFVVAGILVVSLAGIASANIASKTITVTNGECSVSGNPPQTTDGQDCGAAVYDPVLGFTGSITFVSGEGAIQLSDFICENDTDANGPFTSVGGEYTLTLSSGGIPVSGPTTYTIAGGGDCKDGNIGGTTAANYPVSLTVPAGPPATYTVTYSLVLKDFDETTFLGDNSILNRVEELNDGHANSPSVGPPQGSPPVPEAPLSVLLVLTGGLGAAWFISRRMRPSLPAAAA
jgi:hypothetical protein